jgi:hypothetical protein
LEPIIAKGVTIIQVALIEHADSPVAARPARAA